MSARPDQAAYQRTYRATKRRLGLCLRCRAPAEPGTVHCTRHKLAARHAARLHSRRRGSPPWTPGARGRKPKGDHE